MTDERERRAALAALLWKYGLLEPGSLRLADGRRIGAVVPGYEPGGESRGRLFAGASFELPESGVVLHGSVRVDGASSDWERGPACAPQAVNIILHVVLEQDRVLVREGHEVPTLVLSPAPQVVDLYGRMTEGKAECERFFGSLEKVERQQMLSRLMADRLGRKAAEVDRIFLDTGEDWDETAYICMLRSLGMGTRKNSYEALARSLPRRYVLHCGSDPQQIEALLLGQSGYLSRVDPDPYTRQLQDIYIDLKRELALSRPVVAWKESDPVRPLSLPPVMLAHAARILAAAPDLSARVIAAVRRTDAQGLKEIFRTDIPAYWEQHSDSAGRYTGSGMLSQEKSELRIINFVIPFATAYGLRHGDEPLRDSALALYERLRPENNTYIRRWAAHGSPAENAFESQALIQLSTEYCHGKRCGECPVGILRLLELCRKAAAGVPECAVAEWQ